MAACHCHTYQAVLPPVSVKNPVALGVIISAVYGLRAVGRIFFGPPSESFALKLEGEIEDLRWAERLPASPGSGCRTSPSA